MVSYSNDSLNPETRVWPQANPQAKLSRKTPTVPLLFTGGHVIRGSTRVADELIEYFEQQVFPHPLTAKPAALHTASDEASP